MKKPYILNLRLSHNQPVAQTKTLVNERTNGRNPSTQPNLLSFCCYLPTYLPYLIYTPSGDYTRAKTPKKKKKKKKESPRQKRTNPTSRRKTTTMDLLKQPFDNRTGCGAKDYSI